ncbi:MULTISPECIES: ABC transporter substrate-binding protein [Agrobacterium]|uniref:Peptide ABC transporter n=1 Tax=Agrobacterium tumefaciens TaxID=358 RepID=A0AAE6BIJ9_AGRTU|nr:MULTISPECIES: ABC transporter substrate-binding protein [Agrobacterium]QCL77112.1 peptide ABC transporter [Agrobacterium tumefaciens]QCL82621.1 peptide ABC transporter [Agrobacterium tumefaciens]CUX70162.1 ABC-type dipeptide transport system, periplasmic component [Agrobacterium sp. NCPPB 925]
MRLKNILAAALLAATSLAAAVLPVGAKDLLVVDFIAEPSSLDPHVQWNTDSFNVYRNIFDNLLTRDDKGEIAPQIATEWKYLSDTEIEFKIRSDVKFHDGKQLTAEDVAFSIKRITDPKFASPQIGQFNQITDAVAKDPTTLIVTTKGPYPVLLAQLTKLSIVPKHVVEAVSKDEFNLKPVGSGPYKFEAWNRGVEVLVDRNDDYWGNKGAFPKVAFRAVPDGSTRIANLQSGASDLASNLNNDLADQLTASGQGKVLPVRGERLAFYSLNINKPPLNDKRIRQAIAHAIDKQGIVDGILGGFDVPLSQLTSPVSFGYSEGITPPEFSPEKAKALIAEVGDAAKTEFSLFTTPTYDQRVVQAIQQMLADVGLNVKIETTDMGNWMQQMQSGGATIPASAFGRWSCGCQDADGTLYSLLHSSSSWSTIKDERIDKALDEARTTIDPAKRLELYKTVHQIVANENYIIPLYQASVIYGAAKNVEFSPLPNENLFLNRIGWSQN